jgi:hypothetical protein
VLLSRFLHGSATYYEASAGQSLLTGTGKLSRTPPVVAFIGVDARKGEGENEDEADGDDATARAVADEFADGYSQSDVFSESHVYSVFVHTFAARFAEKLKYLRTALNASLSQLEQRTTTTQPHTHTRMSGKDSLVTRLHNIADRGMRMLIEVQRASGVYFDPELSQGLSTLSHVTTACEKMEEMSAAKSDDVVKILSILDTQVHQLHRRALAADKSASSNALVSCLLCRADVVFCTLCVAGRYAVKEAFRAGGDVGRSCDCLVIDEAANASEAELLIPMVTAQPSACVLVGDPQQLSVTVTSQSASATGFSQSLMTRLMGPPLHQPHHMLSPQYRMHPHISSFPNQQFYGGRLADASGLETRTHIIHFPFTYTKATHAPTQTHTFNNSLLLPYSVVDVASGSESAGRHGSYKNEVEATLAAAIAEHIFVHTPELRVAILTFYSGQVACLRRTCARVHRSHRSALHIGTVDSFQVHSVCVFVCLFVCFCLCVCVCACVCACLNPKEKVPS